MSTNRLQTVVLGIALASVAAPAFAQVLQPIDPRKQADVSRQFVDPARIGLTTLSQPTHQDSRKPTSQRSLQFAPADTRSVDKETLRQPSMTFDTRPMPHSNFSAQRAPKADLARDTPTVETARAPITDRIINVYTPAGQEELKRQLRLRY